MKGLKLLDTLKQSPAAITSERDNALNSFPAIDLPPPTPGRQVNVHTAPYLKIAHIVFMDMVGYSRMGMESQAAVQIELQRLVQRTEAVRQAQGSGNLVCRPTGDGMALLFFDNPLSPVHCALEIDRFLREAEDEILRRTKARIQLRMGIHTGPVLMVVDVNDLSDVAGEGIVIAQRIMDCGDAGHILASQEMKEILARLAPWHRYIHDIGTCRVKHGTVIHLYNLYGSLDGTVQGSFHGQAFGSSKIPHKVSAEAAVRVEKALQAQEKRPPRFFAWQPFLNLLSLLVFAGVTAVILGVLWTVSPEFQASVKALTQGKPAVADPKVGQGRGTEPTPTLPLMPPSDLDRSGEERRPNHPVPPKQRQSRAPSLAPRERTPSVYVPDLTGMDFEQAVAAVGNSGIELRISPKSNVTTDQPEGHIYAQSLPKDSRVKGKDGPIYLYVRVSQGILKPEAPSGKLSPPIRPPLGPVDDPPSKPVAPVHTATPEPKAPDKPEVENDRSEISSGATRSEDQ